jgi:RNA polymerase sigma factor for flagellar operon FliA
VVDTDVDELVRRHLSLVAVHVRQLSGKLPPHVDRDDLTAAGLTALVISAQAYHPERIHSFAGFAGARIRWALLDELRGLDWAPRSTRSRARKMAAVRGDLTTALARTPTSAELAEALVMTVKDLDAAIQETDAAQVLSLQGPASHALIDVLADRRLGPEGVMLYRERIGYLRDAVEALSPRPRMVVVRHVLQERPMVEVAAELGVTESRVSQLLAQAVALLRDGINAQLDPDLVSPGGDQNSPVVARRRAAYFARIAASGDLRSRLAITGHDPRQPVRAYRGRENCRSHQRPVFLNRARLLPFIT